MSHRNRPGPGSTLVEVVAEASAVTANPRWYRRCANFLTATPSYLSWDRDRAASTGIGLSTRALTPGVALSSTRPSTACGPGTGTHRRSPPGLEACAGGIPDTSSSDQRRAVRLWRKNPQQPGAPIAAEGSP